MAHRDTPLCRLFDIGIGVVVVVVVVLRVPLELVGAGDGYAVVCYCRNPKYTRRLRFEFYVHERAAHTRINVRHICALENVRVSRARRSSSMRCDARTQRIQNVLLRSAPTPNRLAGDERGMSLIKLLGGNL